MITALSTDNQKVFATPDATGFCPMCQQKLIPKCGPIKIWHFSHQSLIDCDPWWKPESDWHLAWKKLIKPDFVEVLIEKDGERHRCDIKTPYRIFELQYSSLSYYERLEREMFYGNVFWMIRQNREKVRFTQRKRDIFSEYEEEYVAFRWLHPLKWIIKEPETKIFMDFDDGIILDVRKVYNSIPCGGWGYILPKESFIKKHFWGITNG